MMSAPGSMNDSTSSGSPRLASIAALIVAVMESPFVADRPGRRNASAKNLAKWCVVKHNCAHAQCRRGFTAARRLGGAQCGGPRDPGAGEPHDRRPYVQDHPP